VRVRALSFRQSERRRAERAGAGALPPSSGRPEDSPEVFSGKMKRKPLLRPLR